MAAAGYDVVVVGAGILGLASAYHILQADRGLDLLVLDRLPGAGRGTTARSAAAYRDMFTSPVTRHLSQGSISFYENLQETSQARDEAHPAFLLPWDRRQDRLIFVAPAPAAHPS